MNRPDTTKLAPLLWVLLGLFCLRVLGQIVVALFAPSWLPPMDEWYSGLIPYGPLLVAQAIIIVLYSKICIDFMRGSGFFVSTRPVFARGVLYFGYIYFASMVVRYIIRMSLFPDERWFGGCIPIVFHFVLASFIIAFGRYHRRQVAAHSALPQNATWTT